MCNINLILAQTRHEGTKSTKAKEYIEELIVLISILCLRYYQCPIVESPMKKIYQKENFHHGAKICVNLYLKCCKVASTNTSCLEALPGFYSLLMKGKFDACEL